MDGNGSTNSRWGRGDWPKKVAILSDYLRLPYANGATFACQFLYRELRKRGCEVTVIGPADPAARAELRARYGLGERPTVVCVSRLVPRKGQDMLIKALPDIRRRVDGAALVIVGASYFSLVALVCFAATVVPSPIRLCRFISPPCMATRLLTMESPRPVPSWRHARRWPRTRGCRKPRPSP